MIRTFIIDDEAPSRRELKYLLGKIEGVELAGEANSGASGLKGIRETKPQLVFLDIQMPGLSGLELSQFLCEMPDRPLLVFATAYEQYAVDAFDVEACDYILKPFTLERVKKTILKAEKILKEVDAPRAAKDESQSAKKIPLYKGDRIIPASPEKILFARCVDSEVCVHTTDGKYKVRSTMNEFEQKLLPFGFIRTHRSFLINTNHVLEVIPWFNGSFKLVMADRERTEVLVSRQNAKDLKKYFDL